MILGSLGENRRDIEIKRVEDKIEFSYYNEDNTKFIYTVPEFLVRELLYSCINLDKLDEIC